MPTFYYEARDSEGEALAGEIEAEDRLRASLQLREQELWITSLKEAGGGRGRVGSRATERSPRDWTYAFMPVRAGALMHFYDQMADLLEAGVSLHEALDSVKDRVAWRLGPIVEEMVGPVSRGEPVSKQMARYPRVFSRMALGLVEAGEVAGSLPRMMRHLAAEQRTDQMVWLYTSLGRLLWFLMIPLAVGSYVLLPVLEMGMEAQSQQEVIDFIITRLVTWVPTVWIGVVVVDHLLRMLLREPWMAGVRHTILMYLPGFVAWTRTKFYANALLVMHELVRGGVNFQEGFAKAAEAVSPSPLEKQFKAGEVQLRQGRPLQEAVKELKSLPFTARSSMLTAAQVGRQEQSLQSLHEQYAQEMRDSPRRVLLAVIGYHVLVFGTITMVIVVTGGLNYAAALDQLMQP